MNKDTPPGIYDFTARVHDYVVFTHINASASVRVIVQEITDEAIYSSGSLRFTGTIGLLHYNCYCDVENYVVVQISCTLLLFFERKSIIYY